MFSRSLQMELGGSAAKQLISLFDHRLLSEDGSHHMFSRIAEIARELLQADMVVLFVRSPSTGRFDPTPVVSGSITEAERAHLSPPRAEGLSQELITARLLFVNDISAASARPYENAFTRAAGVESFAAAALPATGDQEPVCVLYLDFRSPRDFSDEDKANLRGFADQAALVLRSRLSFEGLRSVRRTGERLTRALDSKQILDEVVSAIREAALADLVVLYPFHPQNRTLLPPVHSGELIQPARPPKASRGEVTIPSRVLETGRHLVLRDATAIYEMLDVPAGEHAVLFVAREQIRSLAALPLVVGDDPIGVLFVNYRRAQELDVSQVEVIQGLSSYAAIAIRNSGVLQGLRDQEDRRLELLRRIDREISGTLDLEAILQIILEESAREVGAEEASILRYDEKKNALVTVAAVGKHAKKSVKVRIPLSEIRGITKWVFRERRPVRVEKLADDPVFGPLHVELAPGFESVSELDVPLSHNGDILGVMNFESSRVAAFSEADQHFLETLAEHAVLAILNADAYQRERRTVNERSIMAEVSKRIAARAELDEIFAFILDQALHLTGATAGEVMIVRREQGHLERVAAHGDIPERKFQGLDEGIIGWVVMKGTSFDKDIREEPWRTLYVAGLADTQSEMTVPLNGGDDDVLGVLDVESRDPQQFGPHDRRLLEALADLAVVAIRNAENARQAAVQLRRFQILHQAGIDLGKITDPGEKGEEAAYDAIIQIANAHTGGEVVIRRFEPATRQLVAKKRAQVQDQPLFETMSVDEPSLNAQVFRERRTIVVHDTDNPPPDVEAILVSDTTTRTLLITPIGGKGESYYGNLSLAHAERYHFLDTDRDLFGGLAQLLALTIQRLEMTSELQDLEQRAAAAEGVTAMNLGAVNLAHRLSDELGPVPASLRHVVDSLPAAVLTGMVRESLELALKGSETVLRLGQSLRKQARAFKSGGTAKTDVPLSAVLADIESSMPDHSDGIEVIVNGSLHAGEMLRVVPGDIVSVVRELVRNAIDALEGAGRIEVRAKVTEDRVEFRCSDSGKGIPPHKQKHVFLPFHSTKGSSGLGLWMGRLVARSAGGDLVVESGEGQGTTFTLWLPRGIPVHVR
jgi:GAF domain-containing protein